MNENIPFKGKALTTHLLQLGPAYTVSSASLSMFHPDMISRLMVSCCNGG